MFEELMTIASIGLQAVGAVSAAVGAHQQAQATNQSAGYNAATAIRNATVARDQAARDAEMQQRDARQKIGQAIANYGASGITMEGSPSDVIASSAMLAELDRQNILYKGELKATGYVDEAHLDTFSGQTALTQGNYRSASAVLSGAGSALKIASNAGYFDSRPGTAVGPQSYLEGE